MTNTQYPAPTPAARTVPARRSRRRNVLVAAAATVAAATVATLVIVLPGGESAASAAVRTAAQRMGSADTLRAELKSGQSLVRAEVAGDDSKIVYTEPTNVMTVIEVAGVRYSFAGDGSKGATGTSIGDDEKRKAPIAASAADVIRALADDENVTEVGAEKVRGRSATHYRVAVSDATRQRLAAVSDTKRVWFELEQVQDLRTVDVWVSDKLITRVMVQGRRQFSGKDYTTTTDFFDFGAPITIKAPRT